MTQKQIDRLTPTDKRMIIAVACGGGECQCGAPDCTGATIPSMGRHFDPFNDLNACHEMEKWLEGNGKARYYADHLAEAVEADIPEGWSEVFLVLNANAEQRVIAFLRTIN